MRLARHLALLWIMALPIGVIAAPERPEITGIALVRLRVTNMDASRAFYAKTLGLPEVSQGCFSPASAAACFSINSLQKLELISSDPAENKNAVETIGYHVRDANSMREYLLSRGVKCSEVRRSTAADKYIEVRDPEDHRIVFLSPGTGTMSTVAISPLSNQIIHAGFVVRDRAAEDAFYKDILGFRLYWHGSPHAWRDEPHFAGCGRYQSGGRAAGQEWLEAYRGPEAGARRQVAAERVRSR
jgi:catechol 2,3-dioxygenase-like lactoylglutathione lyase family enzyme